MAKEKDGQEKVEHRSERADKDRSKGKKKTEVKPLGFTPSYKTILNDKAYEMRYRKEVRVKKDFHIAGIQTLELVKLVKRLARWNKTHEFIIGVTSEDKIEKMKTNRKLRLQYAMNELELREVPIQIIKGLNSYIINPAEGEKILDKKKVDWIFSKQIEEVRFYVS